MEKPSHRQSTVLVPVFVPAVVVIVLLVLGTVSNPQLAGEVFSSSLSYVTRSFGWFYMLSVALFLLFIVGVALSLLEASLVRCNLAADS